MREEKMNTRFLLSIIAIVILYIGLSMAFYFDLVNVFTVVGVLMLLLVLTMIVLFRYRDNKFIVKRVTWMFALVAILLVYDTFLLRYENFTFTASFHADPVQAAAGSGINLMAVQSWNILSIEDKDLLIENLDRNNHGLIDLYEMNNKGRYHSRNAEILQFLGVRNDDFSEMAENVRSYLGAEASGVEQFLKRTDYLGESAGLGLVLTGLIEQNKLKNHLDFGVTGALNEQGEVSGIGMVKEKLMIAEQEGYPFMIIPSENAEEAEQVKEAQNLGIQIFAVSHIDEAVQLINRLNLEQEI